VDSDGTGWLDGKGWDGMAGLVKDGTGWLG
jgi:hypothetical protein